MQEPFFAYSTQRVSTPYKDALPNKKITLAQLADIVKSSPPDYWEKMRALYREGYETGNDAKLEDAKAIKGRLPYFLFSGYCPRHHNDATLEYNGYHQIDWDYKKPGGDVRVRIVSRAIGELMERGALPYVVMCGPSPSAHGLKFLVKTDNADPKNHVAVAKAIFADLNKKLADYLPEGGNFDSLGASQPCYVPYDQDAFFNPSARAFHYVAPEVAPTDAAAPTAAPQQRKPAASNQRHHSGTTADTNDLQAAYNFLLDNRVVLATCYAEYLPVLAGCIAAFGSGGAGAAWDLLEHCPAFLVSGFRKNFDSHTKSIKTANTPPEWLFKQARSHGWRPERRIEKDAPQAAIQATTQAQQGEKLTDTLTRTGETLPGKRWVVPTGAGKTFAVAAFAKAGNKTVLAVPYLSIAQNVAAEYGAVLFDGITRDVPKDAGFFVVTYASLPALSSRLEAVGAWHLFLDEAHNFTASASRGFMYKTLCKVLYIAPSFASLTTLTGTDVETYHPLFLALPKMEVRTPRIIPKTSQVIRTANTLDAAADAVAVAVAAGEKCIVALNDKGTKLAKFRARLDGIEGAKVEYFHSENKDGEAFAELCRNGMFPEGVNVIVTTSVLKEGNNINDQGAFAFIFLGRFHAVEIEQLTARARKATGVEAVIIKGIEDAEKAATAANFAPHKVKYMAEKEAQKKVDALNAAGAAAGWSPYIREILAGGVRALEQAQEGRALPIAEKDGVFVVCPLLHANYVFEAEKGAQYKNDQLQEAELSKYGFQAVRGAVVDVAPTVAPEVERAAVEAYKAQECKEYNETLARLDGRGVTPTTIQNELEQCQTKGGTRSALEVVARVVAKGLTVPDAVAAVRQYAPLPSKKKAGELCDLITYCKLGDNLTRLRRTEVGRFIHSMKTAFRDGEKVTTDELITRMEKVTGKPYNDDKRADKALKVARLVFDVRPTKERVEGGGTGHVWRFCSVNFEYYNKKNKQEINGTYDEANAIFTRLVGA